MKSFPVLLCLGLLLSLPDSVGAAGGTVTVFAAGRDLGVTNLPPGLTNIVAISAGLNDALALREDGTLAAWGDNDYGVTNVPPDLTNVVAISSGWLFHMTLKADGTVATWGHYATAPPPGLSNVVAVAAGGHQFCLALREDHTVAGWGWNGYGQTNVPGDLTNVIAVAAGLDHSLALREDGTVAAWGDDTFGAATVPQGLTNVVAISAGWNQSLALRADGTVVGWGMEATNLPPTLANVVALAGGWDAGHEFLLADGSSYWNWGGPTNVVAIARGHFFSLTIALCPGPSPGWREAILGTTWGNGHFEADVGTRCGRVYQLQYADRLNPAIWTPLALTAGNGKTRRLTDFSATAPCRFYRAIRW